MAKKNNNVAADQGMKKLYSQMRPALVIAHNTNNQKAISKDMIDGAEIDNAVYVTWKYYVTQLQRECFAFIKMQKDNRGKTDKEFLAQLNAAENKIYETWKRLLLFGETDAVTKQLRVQESDVHDLVGFCWTFTGTANGTVECGVKENVFRKKVESLIGCIIAKNAVMTDEDREVVQRYYKVKRAVTKNEEKVETAEKEITKLTEVLSGIPATETEFKAYIESKIKEATKKKEEAESDLKEAKSDLAKKEAEVKKVEAKVKKLK